MKKIIFLLMVLSFIFFSCKKEHASTPKLSGKKYAVKFNVANFAQQKGVFSIGSTGKLTVNGLVDPKDYLDELYYIVYSPDGFSIQSIIIQDSTMANMGTIIDSLPNGTYPVRIIAGKNGLNVDPTSLPIATYGYHDGLGWRDAFWAGFDLTVSGGLTRNVTLARTISKLEIQISGYVPPNAATFNVSVGPQLWDQNFYYGRPEFTANRGTLDFSTPVANGNTFDRLVNPADPSLPSVPISVTISSKDAGGNVLAITQVNNVSFVANRKTILSGSLFSAPGPGSSQTFQVKIDTAWASTPNIVHF